MFKHTTIALALGATLAAGSAFALPTKPSAPSVSVNGSGLSSAGSFTQQIDLTTAGSYSQTIGTITLSGFANSFSQLSFSLLGYTFNTGPTGINNTIAGTFSDASSAPNLGANTTYHLLVSGKSLVSDAAYSVNATGGFAGAAAQSPVAAVPEPESYAMFLAGLGLMGVVARRRRGN